ncbi:MAG: peptidase and in kexin sedolisin [Actinotalea sp.]|nr:peptidase and in kexin sedolisin [Actinotalea sp.]
MTPGRRPPGAPRPTTAVPRTARLTAARLTAARVTTGCLLSGGLVVVAVVTGTAPAVASAAQNGPRNVQAVDVQECDPDVEAKIPERPSGLLRLGADDAWRLATGDGVVVAVVDSGVDARNDHFAGGVVLPGTDVVGQGGDPAGLTDLHGHGTAVAGVIAARLIEGSGVEGLAPGSLILPVRVYHSTTEQAVEAGVGVQTGRIAEGVRWAAEHGAEIISISLSSTHDDPELAEAVRLATERGALVVASAGNRTTTEETEDSPRYPAAYPDVLAVTAVDDLDRVTQDSVHGPHVDVAAPGTNVLTTYFDAGDCQLGGEVSASYATAYVSAAAALVAERFPEETPQQWAHRLEATAVRARVDARDDLVGWGVVRPAAALAFVDDGTAPGPPSPVHPAPVVVPDPPADLGIGETPDLLAPAQTVSAWWLLAGVAVTVGALLASRLTVRRRRAAAR